MRYSPADTCLVWTLSGHHLQFDKELAPPRQAHEKPEPTEFLPVTIQLPLDALADDSYKTYVYTKIRYSSAIP